MEGFYKAGGVPAVMKELIKNKKLNTKVLTVTGKKLAENLNSKIKVNKDVIKDFKNNLSEHAGFLVLKGNFFSSAIMKTSVISDEFKKRYLTNPKSLNSFT